MTLRKAGSWILLACVTATFLFLEAAGIPVSAQQAATDTPAPNPAGPSTEAFITVTYIEPINVRTGPGSFDYPVVGSLPVGGNAQAIGRSPAGEWIEIVFPGAPNNIGWVYAANVSLSPNALLPIVEPPPTPTPLETPTTNPTFAAAFQNLPTSTRLPTFTPPPALTLPTFSNPVTAAGGRPITVWVIILLGLVGIVGIVVSSLLRK